MTSPVSKSEIFNDLVESSLVGFSSVQHMRKNDILVNVELGQKVIKLVDQTDMPSSEDSKLVF